MKLCTFAVATSVGDHRRVGVITREGIIDATAARVALLERSYQADAAHRIGCAQVPPDMRALIGTGG